MAPRLLFFVGKGGVGKSTLSALTALAQADAGRQVLLLSLDPAHNQSDLFGRDFGDTPLPVDSRLSVMEADIGSWITRYLKEVRRNVEESYTYLTAFNLEQHFRVLRHSPGLEEFALQRVLERRLREDQQLDTIVVDMPPTALTTRFFASPSLTRSWTEQLLALRRSIRDQRAMITNIKVGKREIEQDRVLRILETDLEHNRELEARYADRSHSAVQLVLNPDSLSWREGRRLREKLAELGIQPAAIVMNKAVDSTPLPPPEFSDLPLISIPSLLSPPIGEKALRTCLSGLTESTRGSLASL